jgi:ABC-type nitrate/sulfonate/bicarbonate transport system permease component
VRIVRRVAPPLVFLALVLGAWQLYASVADISSATLPTPTEVASALWDQRDLLSSAAWVTIQEIVLGYLLAVAVGVALAVAISASRLVERAVYPWLVVSQMVPIVAIAPIIVIWTGFDLRPKVIVIALVSFFPIAVNTIDGLRSTDPAMVDLLRSMGADGRRRFRLARLPAALPFLFSGLKVAAALAVIGAVFAEWVGASDGLGYLILTFNNQTATADVFACVVVLAAIGIALFGVVLVAEKVLLPWYHGTRRNELRVGGRE